MKLKNDDKIEGNSTVISGLTANTRYMVKVRGKNRDGFSDFADDLIIRTRSMQRPTKSDTEMVPQVNPLFAYFVTPKSHSINKAHCKLYTKRVQY